MTTEIPPTRPTSGEQKQPAPEVLERPQRQRFTAEQAIETRLTDGHLDSGGGHQLLAMVPQRLSRC